MTYHHWFSSFSVFRKRESDMLREQHLGPDQFQRVHDPRRSQSNGVRRRRHRGHINIPVRGRSLSVADNDVAGHFRLLPVQVSRNANAGCISFSSRYVFIRCTRGPILISFRACRAVFPENWNVYATKSTRTWWRRTCWQASCGYSTTPYVNDLLLSSSYVSFKTHTRLAFGGRSSKTYYTRAQRLLIDNI